jgi:hypothetical protein
MPKILVVWYVYQPNQPTKDWYVKKNGPRNEWSIVYVLSYYELSWFVYKLFETW